MRIEQGLDKYHEFLKAKVRIDQGWGFPCEPKEVSPHCKPFTRDIVAWAVRGGRRAIFARYGLGKSVMQLEVLRLIVEHASNHGAPDAFGRLVRRGLIVAPPRTGKTTILKQMANAAAENHQPVRVCPACEIEQPAADRGRPGHASTTAYRVRAGGLQKMRRAVA